MDCVSSASWGQCGILGDRASTLQHIKHLIGDGKSTRFWLDPWLPGGRLIDQFGARAAHDLGLGRDVLVSHFITNGCRPFAQPISSRLATIFLFVSLMPKPSVDFCDEVGLLFLRSR